ncbi:MAG TPA: hemerythrin domain-containing protein [Rhodanobacter sp.]
MKLFDRKTPKDNGAVTFEDQLAEQQVAPGTQIHYDSRLIERFRGHHEALAATIAKASDAAKGSRFEDAQAHMTQFKQILNQHLLEKTLRLYTYLGCCLHADPEGLQLTRDMRRETGQISRRVTRFIQDYSAQGINEENKARFLEDLEDIGEVLQERFAREERTLYVMYRPPQAYQDHAIRALPVGIGHWAQSPLTGLR